MSSDDSLVNEAVGLVEEAEHRGLILRVLGALAIRLHCPENQPLLDAMKRVITDIDFAAYGQQKADIVRFIVEHGYSQRQHLTIGTFVGREIFESEDGKHIDVFLDKLEYCHTVHFKNRLEKDRPTIPLSELLLEKTQIVQINEKDLKDLTVILLEHEIGEGDREAINAKEISKILFNDWGFYYTVTTNLKRIIEACSSYDVLNEDQRKLVAGRATKVLEHIENEPKTLGWKVRAKIGPAKKWYRDVEEVDRADWLSQS